MSLLRSALGQESLHSVGELCPALGIVLLPGGVAVAGLRSITAMGPGPLPWLPEQGWKQLSWSTEVLAVLCTPGCWEFPGGAEIHDPASLASVLGNGVSSCLGKSRGVNREVRAGSETAASALFLLPCVVFVQLQLRSAVASDSESSIPCPRARVSSGDKCREVCAPQGFGFPAEEESSSPFPVARVGIHIYFPLKASGLGWL